MRSGSVGSKGKSMARLRVLPAFSSTVVFAVVTAAVCLTAVAAAGAATLKCERFDASCEGGDNCAGVEVCERGHNACFAVWKVSGKLNHKSGQSVSKMGCFTFHNEEDCRLGCTSEVVRPRQIHLCCCFGSMCNSNFSYVPAVPAAAEPSEDLSQNASTDAVGNIILHKKYPGYLVYVIVIVVVFVLAVIVCVGMYVYRQRKAARLSNSPLPAFDEDNDNNGKVSAATTVPSPTSCQQIELLEIKARGRFGAVWKGRRAGGGEIVAVKIFPLQDRCSWQAEQEIYNLPRMDHDNILKFIGVEKCGENLAMEFWLTTEFHDVGSLCDFLKSNVLSWADVCKIAFSVCRGLNHMHEEIPKGGGRDMKPAIAHRDFKSKNVLIKSDMTACIADFGLALVFEPGKACGDTHGQVGTRRYMAPEVLEGAINFSRDAFLRIDMYACGLVLWELASRHNNDTVAEYKLPFEAEVTSPTLEQMREFVVNRKRRPHINNEWRRTPSTLALCDTIEECWDHDAEARLSASCVMERIRSLQRLNNDRAAAAVAVEQMNAMNADETASVEMIPLIISDHCSS